MKKYICLLMCLTFCFITSCNNSDVLTSSFVYDGYTYDYAEDSGWEISAGTEYSLVKIKLDGHSYQAMLYDDDQVRFIKVKMPLNDILYHKSNDKFPNCTDFDSVEKIVLLYNDGKETINEIKNGEELFNEFCSFFEKYNDSENKNIGVQKILAIVQIYFLNYPAYQQIGYIVETEFGEKALHLNKENSETTMKGYQIIPFDIP